MTAMKSSSRRHELLCIGLLGIGTLFLYLGYFTQRFISESIIHSVHVRHPARISKHAGYYGQAVHQSVFGLSCLAAPTIQRYMASKWALVTCAVLFCAFYLGFFHVNRYFFYFTQILMGCAYSLYNNGEGAYIAEHSSRQTVESNTAIETAVGHSSMLFGGLVLFYVFYTIPEKHLGIVKFRDFSDSQIQAINGMFFGLTVLAAIIFAVMPNRQQADSIALASPKAPLSFSSQMSALWKTAINLNVILLCTTCFYFGILISFLLGVYPTTLTFTASLAKHSNLIATYCVSIGSAQIIGGISIGPILKRIPQKKVQVLALVHAASIATAVILFWLSTPSRSTINPNDGASLLIHPSPKLVVVIAFLIGIGDFAITTARVTMCQLAKPENRNEVFSLTRISMCLSSCIVLFLSSRMTVECWSIVLLSTMLIGTVTLLIVANRATRVGTPQVVKYA